MSKLQIALDMIDLQQARELAQATASHTDVIEAGTLLCLAEGMHAVRKLRADHPTKEIMADIRIVRAGKKAAELAFAAGANIVSIVAEAPQETAEAAVAVARACGGRVQMELGEDDQHNLLKRWLKLGVNEVIMHSSPEAGGGAWQTESALSELHTLVEQGCKVIVAGSVDETAATELARLPVSTIVVGGAICKSDDPTTAARNFAEILAGKSTEAKTALHG